MIILGIDTSCDDTCIAILEIRNSNFKIRINVVSSQAKLHQKYGGVWPFLAKREHQKNLPIVFKKALQKIQRKKIDLIAITIGPGLEPCLWVGVNFSKELAQKLNSPILPINHIEAHIYANLIGRPGLLIQFPAICLVVSGGHTQLILMKGHLQYKILGETRDDAAGECFDKVARILGLGYPGGPAIAAEAKKLANSQISKFKISLPRPMIYQKNYDFSFSGLKTAALYDFKNRSPKVRKSKTYIREMARELQQAIIDVLLFKTLRAAQNYKVKTIILGGGVAANKELRRQFKKACSRRNLEFLAPAENFSTDNAAMVAVTAYYHWLKGETKSWGEIKANANLRLK